MSTHDVGTVLWIIHTDRPGLMAYQVTEEITKKTLEGEKIQYIVRAALPKSKEPVKLNSSLTKSPKLQKRKSGYQWVTMDDGSKVQVKLPETLS